MNAADDVPQSERRRIMADERRGRTYQGNAIANADDERRGRYAHAGNSVTVTGAAPISYPRLPSDAPSNQAAIVGDEPPLGIDVNAMEPVGEIHEREPKRKGWRRI